MNSKLYKLMNWPEIEEIIYSDGDDPHRILGAHKVGANLLIQTFYPTAEEITVVPDVGTKTYKMELADEAGFFAEDGFFADDAGFFADDAGFFADEAGFFLPEDAGRF